ncbi:MAG: thymidine phosphorylase [Candidatus Eisenbacteria bacterium]|uniref:Thymidine phosphorylase n=1 Tax=Eiseniibacteriota bacterium TaxID=2212470 RepID=A0A538SVV4_UNCEI|nr:MAG: thymidine phosphorylase [Candidatus Eisenbacteria bacterium]
MRDVIRAKRDGGALSRETIGRWIRGVADGSIPDYESAALLMAITIRGMDRGETAALTDAMLHSGRVLEWNGIGRPTVDKHSTGGVGDKISIALAPWVAACGAAVPMIVGRGLGHTGGTRDKLEAIPGFRTGLSADEFSAQVRRIGVVIAGQSGELAPADGKLYALRDVTATVESRPLIVASIMSKKLAAGASGIVFDVKCGRGAIMETPEAAKGLAQELVGVARELGRKARAIITAMDQPLGLAIGNASETAEALTILRGEGPPDVTELSRILGAAMLVLGGVAREVHDALARMDRALDSGSAVQRAEAMIQTQGGDPRVTVNPSILPRAPVETQVRADRAGFVGGIDSRALGLLLVAMGGGRELMEDRIDHGVGIRLLRKAGDQVAAGETLAILEARRDAPDWAERAGGSYQIAEEPPSLQPLVIEDLGR